MIGRDRHSFTLLRVRFERGGVEASAGARECAVGSGNRSGQSCGSWRTTSAGTPDTSVSGGTSRRTTEPALTTLPAPIVTPGRIVEPTPIQAPSPMITGVGSNLGEKRLDAGPIACFPV